MAFDAWSAPNEKYPPPKPGEPPLHVAARRGDHDRIRALVKAGTPLDDLFDIALDPGARPELASPLMVAAGSADGATAETVGLLLDLGASIDAGESGVSALWYASQGLGWNYPPGGDATRLALLLAAGADPRVTRPPRHHRGGVGVSALARAARTGDAERVRLLLEAGADPAPEGAVPPYEVPFYQAVESGSVDTVRLLISAGATPSGPIAKHDDPVVASAVSAEVLAELLAAGADPDASCGYGKTVVEAIARGARATVGERIAMLRLLVEAGVDLDSAGNSALYGAAMAADPSAVEALLAAGADPRTEPTPMGAVCFICVDTRNEQVERVIEILVDAGIDPDDENAAGYRPLHTALLPDTYGPGYQESDGFNAAAAVALIRRGASIDITFPESGYTPLHAAAAAGSDDVVEALLVAGADPSQRAFGGLTPLEIATNLCSKLTEEHAQIATLGDDHDDSTELGDDERDEREDRLSRARRCVALLEAALA